MTASGISRELRRLIAEIAAAPAEDRSAILDELQPELRARAVTLLDDLGQSSILTPPQVEVEKDEPPPFVAQPAPIEGLSPWLQRRLDQAGSGDTSIEEITPAAAAALRVCAAALLRSGLQVYKPTHPPSSGPKSPSLLHKLLVPNWGRR